MITYAGFIANVDRRERLLRERADKLRMHVSGDGRIAEADMAKLLGYSKDDFRNARRRADPEEWPKTYPGCGQKSKISYDPRGWAMYLETKALTPVDRANIFREVNTAGCAPGNARLTLA